MLFVEENTKLNILGVEYTLLEVDYVNKYEPVRGQINHMTAEILVDRHLPEKIKTVTLLHEILHAICDLLGYDDLGEDEEKIKGLSTALHQVLTEHDIIGKKLAGYTAKELIGELKQRKDTGVGEPSIFPEDGQEVRLYIDGKAMAERLAEGINKGSVTYTQEDEEVPNDTE